MEIQLSLPMCEKKIPPSIQSVGASATPSVASWISGR